MRKKSHILLAKYMADQMMWEDSLQRHRKAFCFGSVLPDIKPSFLTVRHEFSGTFELVQKKLLSLVKNGMEVCSETVFWRRLGEIIHYVADYFTFPHNDEFHGSFWEHSRYEKELKHRLKDCIKKENEKVYKEKPVEFDDFAQVMEYIKYMHRNYIQRKRSVQEDVCYILTVCFQVFQGALQICANIHAEWI